MRPAEPLHYPPDYRALSPGVSRELVATHAADGVPLHGILYLPGGVAGGEPAGPRNPERRQPDVALLALHPRADFKRHYVAPLAALGGYAFLGLDTRHLNHDADALHERLLLDVAAGIAWLRARGFARVVLLGNSGGGSLGAFYLEQAGLPAAERLERAPSGDRVPLREVELPLPDGFAVVAAHGGQGAFLLERLDPSVIDEGEPALANPRLDMFDPRNGYRPMAAGPSTYSADFLAEYRAAQRARCERLDQRCLAWCEEAAWWRRRLGAAEGGGAGSGGAGGGGAGSGGAAAGALPPEERARAARLALQRRYLVVYRTLADPRYLDPRLDPNRRPLGSIFAQGGRDPVAGNYGEGLARAMSARGWLSTWSGLTSRASLARTLPAVRVPLLIVNADADTEIYPREVEAQLGLASSPDKTLFTLERADHYLRPQGPQALGDPRQRLWDEALGPWLRARWPA